MSIAGLTPGVAYQLADLCRLIEQTFGLQVLLFEPHEAARIEWQLCGRSGRQGARGRAQAFVTLRDVVAVVDNAWKEAA